MLLILQNFVLTLNQRKRPIMTNRVVLGRNLTFLLSLFMGLELASQRELISIFNTDIYSGEDVYSAGVYNNWTGSYQINLPKPEKVERIVVEAA